MSIVLLDEPGLARNGVTVKDARGERRAVVYFDGQPFVWGVPETIKPLRGVAVSAQVRFRFRQDAEGLVFLRGNRGLECWTLDDYGDHWWPGVRRAMNYRHPCR